MQNTAIEFDEIISECRDLFSKNARLRSCVAGIAPKFYYRSDLHKSKPYPYPANDDSKMVDEDERGEFIAIINYSIIGLIQLEKDLPNHWTMIRSRLSNCMIIMLMKLKSLCCVKIMIMASMARDAHFFYYGFDLPKVLRTKQIEDNKGKL